MKYQTHKNAEIPGIFLYCLWLMFISKTAEELENLLSVLCLIIS